MEEDEADNSTRFAEDPFAARDEKEGAGSNAELAGMDDAGAGAAAGAPAARAESSEGAGAGGEGAGAGEGAGESSSAFSAANSSVGTGLMILGAIVAVVVLVKVSLSIINSMLNPSKIVLVKGMVPGTQQLIIVQDPAANQHAQPLPRSSNQVSGLEFSWSVWIFIENLEYFPGQYKHIFSKGDSNYGASATSDSPTDPSYSQGMYMINAPGLYLAPYGNEIIIVMNTYNAIYENITIDDIPLNKWFNVIMRCEGANLDVFINGTITKSMALVGVPKQNYGDVNVGLNNGFQGYLSNLTYYSYAMGTKEIFDLVRLGPDIKTASDSMLASQGYLYSNYLSLRWYFFGAGDLYNPAV